MKDKVLVAKAGIGMSKYQPELGQLLIGNSSGNYNCKDYVQALINYILEELERVYFNRNQKWGEEFGVNSFKLGKVRYFPYYWGNRKKLKERPNFWLEGAKVKIYWYKHSERGLSSNVNYTPERWISWFNKCVKEVRKHDTV